MLNRVVLVGRLTKDPEYRTTPSGVGVATFTLAVNRTFTNNQGEREADFINCVVFRKQAENVSNFLFKGSLAGVDGRLQSRSYENQEGRRVYVTEVVCDSVQFLEPKSQNQRHSNNQGNDFQSYGQGFGGQQQGQNSSYQNNNSSSNNDNPFANANGPIDISDDDLPF
ncbi:MULTISPECIES: single-stranded DNA-binding protein [Staphylococcus]|uniref:Single-stranded DNA-binding protein n=1 Tax=Staphylococcus chromogenes TaxID=46126 RepID=A0AAE5T1X0_STACR|nr:MULTISPECIES: single-stranded DNA-binding protein [Staphylococcus]KDP12582.1 single-strand DNA-binding protein [Staphylococcus chromogenes MU 970]MBV5137780.1 single-stranded DNA-binding protein [Staphylococcus chromogenes]MBV5191522.1 single-stranded DNA-binding protein [Staphylococcus chromogenes]MBW3131870.1 single-stranded DNA-binding protein [Staphylococcus chromogenes]MBW6089349.1 single-stranded DNA-binding protein [Staphylococcus chromogenes]